jgi:hypothetical protein
MNRNLEGQWNNIKKCLVDTMRDCVGKVEKRARKPWITQEMIIKMDERRKWKSVNKEEGWSIALCGAETWTLRKLDQKYLESFEMSSWRRMEKISWTDRVNNEAVLYRVKEKRNILHTIRRRKANWIGHILRRNYLLSNIIEGKIIGTRRRGKRHKQLLDDLKEARRYWKLKEEAQDCALWRTQFGRGYGPVARPEIHTPSGI